MGTDTGNPTLVTGVLCDSLGKPLANAEISIRSLNAPTHTTALAKVTIAADTSVRTTKVITDVSGAFEVSGLAAGRYALVAMAPAKGQGLLVRFVLDSKDSLVGLDSLNTMALQRLAWPIPAALEGDSSYLLELDRMVALTGDSLIVDSVPSGFYTLYNTKNVVIGTSIPTENCVDALAAESSAENALCPSAPIPSSTSSSSATESSSSSVTGSSSSAITGSSSSAITGSSSSAITGSSSSTVTLIDNRSGVDEEYRTIQANTQTWMAENLRYAGVDSTLCKAMDATCSAYGRFYTYAQAQLACPMGWHLPSQLEWKTLLTYSSTAVAGTNLKSSAGWASGNGADTFKFAVLPAGTGETSETGTEAWFWTSTASSATEGMAVQFTDTSTLVSIVAESTNAHLSVRCVQD